MSDRQLIHRSRAIPSKTVMIIVPSGYININIYIFANAWRHFAAVVVAAAAAAMAESEVLLAYNGKERLPKMLQGSGQPHLHSKEFSSKVSRALKMRNFCLQIFETHSPNAFGIDKTA